jgi:fucose 4-O-acetylase-like acetyltransferase
MTDYLSKKLSFFSFWLMLGVVVLHSVILDDSSLPSVVQRFISYYLLQICVPMFFMISGYLFFLNVKDMSFTLYLEKLRKRFKTLVLPYFIWSLFIFALIYLLQQLPFFGGFFPQKFSEMDNIEIVKNAIIYPYNYPLWFLRELILFIILTPLIYFCLRYIGKLFLLALFLFGLFQDSFFYYHIHIIHVNSLLFFALGGYLGLSKHKLIFSNRLTLLSGVLFIILNLLCFLYDEKILFIHTDDSIIPIIFKFFRSFKNLAGSLFVWLLFDFIMKTKKIFSPRKYYKYSFFIFLIHGVPTVIFVKICQKFLFNPYVSFVFYLFVPTTIILLCVIFGHFLEKNYKHLYKTITGMR